MILVCGEALVDLTPATCGGEPGLVPRPGGSPFNVAVGLGRLGAATAFVGGVSRDALGGLLWRRLHHSGVDTALLRPVDAPTPLAVVQLDGDGAATYSFYLAGSALEHPPPLPGPLPPEVQAVHVGSIALALEPVASAVHALLHGASGTRLTTLDLNIREPFAGDRTSYLRRLDAWLEAACVVKASDEDLAWLHPHDDPLDVAARWVADGLPVAVVTHGPDGASALADGASARVPAAPATVVDTVGAGDAFMAGLLCWLAEHGALSRRGVERLDAAGLEGALRFGSLVAAAACGRAGADPPWRAELDGPGPPA